MYELFAVDTETKLFFPSTMAPGMICMSVANSRTNGRVLHANDPETLRLLTYILERCGMTTANGPYDLGVIARRWPHLLPLIFQALEDNRIFDVLIREKLIDIGRGTYRFTYDAEGNRKGIRYSLADIFQRYTGLYMEKDEYRMRYHDFEHVPVHQWPEGGPDIVWRAKVGAGFSGIAVADGKLHFQLAPRRHGLNGIACQVPCDLLHLIGISEKLDW